MTRTIRLLLALASISTFLLTGCEVNDGQGDPPIFDDDDNVETPADDDDAPPTEYGTVILDATLPNVQLTLTPIDDEDGSEARDVLTCTTLCTLEGNNRVPVGDYRVTGTVENGLVVPMVITVYPNDVCDETVTASLAPNGSYDVHDGTCDGPTIIEDLNVSTTEQNGEVRMSMSPIGNFSVIGNEIQGTGGPTGQSLIASDLETMSITSDDGSQLCFD